MSEKAVKITRPLGARTRKRRAAPSKNLKLAEQMALRGASESLVRAVGGNEAVEKLMSEDEEAAGTETAEV